MTPITKAEKKLQDIRVSASCLLNTRKRQVDESVEKMEQLIEIFTGRKRKTEKRLLDSLYEWFDDEFNVIYEEVIGKIEGWTE